MKASLENPAFRYTLLILSAYLLFQTLFWVSSQKSHTQAIERSIVALEKRIALDVPWLQLPNEAMNTAADEPSVRRYLQSLNQQAKQMQMPIRIHSLQGIQVQSPIEFNHALQRQLQTPGQELNLQVGTANFSLLANLSVWPFLATALLFLLSKGRMDYSPTLQQSLSENAQPKRPRLIINLHDRSLSCHKGHHPVQLSNKPLCFYLAVLEYCQQNDKASLSHNKDMPQELLDSANRYFSRLIELGHTIRKRPDFRSNLDKMLSEVRAALDEAFKENPEAKMVFYPPKAQGEGSRSKVHSYALDDIKSADIEIIGK
ncbi:hypothetical protein P2G88_00675 [Aliiglaciecola sp. CAU 1673]|uniref:hypothetical protein n=1 Tax=Aliiglaciecola sp. CAU 1673 TaxID=3032595 RepID=UPI0023DA234E|nr:hypothetical protein [Aliiglaciecola sp. CAU 1673]MDF2176762.1 hypothetical protein [Aliiglaciecola sp. CAU 1673]